MTVRYWFVRHGESTANAEGWLAGHMDAPLTARGEAQANRLRESLAGITPERVWTSDLVRAARTAAIGWDHRLPPVSSTARLRERHLGAWERADIATMSKAGHMKHLMSWSGRPPDGESQVDVARRALTFLAERDDAPVLLFAHGGLLRCVVGLLDGLPTDRIGSFKIANTEVLIRDVVPGTWQRLLDGLGSALS